MLSENRSLLIANSHVGFAACSTIPQHKHEDYESWTQGRVNGIKSILSGMKLPGGLAKAGCGW